MDRFIDRFIFRVHFLRFLFAFLIVALFLAPVSFAMAATAPASPGTAIDFAPLLNTIVIPIIGAIAAAIGAWALAKIATLAHLSGQSALRNFLEQIIDNGIAWAVQKLGTLPPTYTTVQVNNSIVAQALQYVTMAAPGILKSLGLDLSTQADRQQLENWILARLGVANGATTPGVPTVTTPAAVAPPAAPATA